MTKLALLFLAFCFAAAATTSYGCLQHCPQHWVLFNDKCYRYYGRRLVWGDADKFCGSIYTAKGRAHLAVIHSEYVNNFLYDMFHSYAGDVPEENDPRPLDYGAWLGMTRDDQDNLSSWVDGSAIDYTNWLTPQPDNLGRNEGCVHFWRLYNADDVNISDGLKGWNDRPCSDPMPFICEVQPDVLRL